MTLRIPNGTVILPVWPAPSYLDPATGVIHVTDFEGKQLQLRASDTVALTGHGGTPEFLVAPPAGCVADSMFVVALVEPR